MAIFMCDHLPLNLLIEPNIEALLYFSSDKAKIQGDQSKCELHMSAFISSKWPTSLLPASFYFLLVVCPCPPGLPLCLCLSMALCVSLSTPSCCIYTLSVCHCVCLIPSLFKGLFCVIPLTLHSANYPENEVQHGEWRGQAPLHHGGAGGVVRLTRV